MVVLLSVLLDLMIVYNTVSTDFDIGIVIPFVKDTDDDAPDNSNFRSITLSLSPGDKQDLRVDGNGMCDKLESDQLQLGFKPNTNCRHAIHGC